MNEDIWIILAGLIGWSIYQLFVRVASTKKSKFPTPPPKKDFSDVPDFRPKPKAEPPSPVEQKQEEVKPKKKKKVKEQPPKPPTVTMGELLERFSQFKPKKQLTIEDDAFIHYEGRHSILTEQDYAQLVRARNYELAKDEPTRFAMMLKDTQAIRDAFILNELLNRKDWDAEF